MSEWGPYVWFALGITWGVLGLYTFLLLRRQRAAAQLLDDLMQGGQR